MKVAKPESIFLAGPTASGKSEVALRLAEQVGGEIISVDSMQVYRGLDIGTAKPSMEERERIPHHLLDVAELSDTFDAARFCERARGAEQAIRARQRTPIFCGGTGLYFKAYLGGLGDAPPSDRALRAALEAVPLPDLLRELADRDPVTFASIDRNNPRRIVRAVEVIRLTGKPRSAQRADWSLAQQPGRFIALHRDSGDLRRRLEWRVDRMFERGLVEEVRGLMGRGLAGNRTALQALGYRQVTEHLEGKRSLEETVALVKIRTWQFARRQMTWFRRQLRPEWLHVAPNESATDTTARILARFKPQ
ncbi:MAG: tRNA (adenosine(37)-N6)-dimethylallyltransferase MiaA [Verrucomicrobia bacterium]|jgi:tRNA dimethylallyltransferase|nr:tRNA (adenosine(37)-N6)-dimethylallyltransferase MiaA [Verrucomicrobiota bacterium]